MPLFCACGTLFILARAIGFRWSFVLLILFGVAQGYSWMPDTFSEKVAHQRYPLHGKSHWPSTRSNERRLVEITTLADACGMASLVAANSNPKPCQSRGRLQLIHQFLLGRSHGYGRLTRLGHVPPVFLSGPLQELSAARSFQARTLRVVLQVADCSMQSQALPEKRTESNR